MSSIPGVTSVGVVGAGLMGTGIAQVCLQAGYDVVVFDSNPEAVLRADARIKKVLGDGFAGGSLVLANFMGELADCELIIEAVFERRDVKQAALKELGQIAPNSILASNTSTLSITDLASVTPDPRKVAGAHFFSPVPKMKALEVVRALQFFYTSTQFNQVHHIFLSGGTASIPGLPQVVAERTQVNTLVANPFGGMEIASKIKQQQLAVDAPALMVACGLALRRFDD